MKYYIINHGDNEMEVIDLVLMEVMKNLISDDYDDET